MRQFGCLLLFTFLFFQAAFVIGQTLTQVASPVSVTFTTTSSAASCGSTSAGGGYVNSASASARDAAFNASGLSYNIDAGTLGTNCYYWGFLSGAAGGFSGNSPSCPGGSPNNLTYSSGDGTSTLTFSGTGFYTYTNTSGVPTTTGVPIRMRVVLSSGVWSNVTGGYHLVLLGTSNFNATVFIEAFYSSSWANGADDPLTCVGLTNNTWYGAVWLYDVLNTDLSNQTCTSIITDFYTYPGIPAVPSTPAGVASLCNGDPTSIFTSSSSLATSFNWSVTGAGNTISGSGSTGTVTWDPLFVGTADISVTATNDCGTSGPSAFTTVTVFPIPSLSSSLNPPAICSGTSFSYTATSSVSGATFTWSRAVVAGISEGASSGTGDVNEVLTNNTNAPINVTYVYVSSANGCTNSGENLVVTVNPLPVVSFSGLAAAYCEDASGVLLTGAPSGGTFTGTGISGDSFFPSIAGPGTYTITYTFTDGNFCTNSTNQPVTVNALPVVSFSGLDTSYCIDVIPVTLIGNPSGGTFTGQGISGNFFDPASAGSGGPYPITYTYTDINGCTNSTNQSVTVFSLPVVFFSGLASQYCVDAPAANLTGTPAGGSFSGSGISGNSFSPAISGAGGHAITYLYSDSNGCSNTEVQNVIVYDLPVVGFSGLDSAYCINESTPVPLTGIPSGGLFTGSGISGNNFIPSLATVGTIPINYSFTDTNGCTNSTTQNIIVHGLPFVNFSGLGAAYCISDSNQIILTGLPAGGLFTGNGVNGNIFIPSTSLIGNQNITYTYSDGNGCTNYQSQTVAIYSLPLVDFAWIDSTYCINDTLVPLYGFPSGGNFSGNGIIGTGFYPNQADTGINVITYAFTDNNGCSNAISKNAIVFDAPVAGIASSGPSSFCQGNSVDLTAATSDYYQWSNGASAQTITVVSTGNYSVTVSNFSGCKDTTSINVTVFGNPAIVSTSLTHVLCNGGNNGNATVSVAGGNFPYTYQWDNNTGNQSSPTATALSAGTYSLTVSDANNCFTFTTVTITEPPLLNLNVSTIYSCFGESTGSAIASLSGGVTPYSFLWDSTAGGQTTSTVSGLIAGTYSVTVSDTNGCVLSSTVNVPETPPIVSNLITSDVICNGKNDGTASVTISSGDSPFSYLWSNGQITSSVNNLAAGNFLVIVTDSNSCSDTMSILITEPPPLIISGSSISEQCDLSNGSATVAVAGGIIPYSYLWDLNAGGQTSPTASGLAAGLYSISVADSNGCTESIMIIVNGTNSLSTIASSTPVTCNGGNDGTAIVAANGGTTPFSYLWSNGDTTALADSLSSGKFYVTVTNANGCSAIDSVTLSQPPPISYTITSDTIICSGDTIMLTATGGQSYLWSSGQNTSSILIAPTCALGINCNIPYSVGLFDPIGCVTTATVNITVISEINAIISGDTNICLGKFALLSSYGATNYVWSTGSTNNSITVYPILSTVYSVTSSNSCFSDSDSLKVNVSYIDVSVSNDTTILMGESASLFSAGGISYLWDPVQNLSCYTCSDPVASPISNTTFTVSITDVNGCSGMDTVMISVDSTKSVFVPNVFSPNGDGQNDALFVMGKGIVKMNLTIFDRWGEKVFESDNKNRGWNGISSEGFQMNSGVYVYYFSVEFYDGEKEQGHGNITLLK